MIAPSDRLLVFAPHPDDESLAIGGLLLRAFAARIPTRVIYLTNGDNNPWAQRFCERRWRLGLADRMRWGERRKKEALAALVTLGGKNTDAVFLDLPDQGITGHLRRGNHLVIARLRQELVSWKPTVLLQPAAEDLHPDHNALHVLLALARSALRNIPHRAFDYVVHSPEFHMPENRVEARLSSAEVGQKLQAILCHETQLAASRRRFTAYAKPREYYFSGGSLTWSHPAFSEAVLEDAALHLTLHQRYLRAREAKILLVMQTESGDGVFQSLTIPRGGTSAYLTDEASGAVFDSCQVLWQEDQARVLVSGLPPLRRAFLKLIDRTWFFDRAGWIRIPLRRAPIGTRRVRAHGSSVIESP